MGFQMYITRLKCLFRNRSNMFWCYAFPLILVTCYYFAFGDMWNANNLKTISIAYVQEGEEPHPSEAILRNTLEKSSIDNGNPLFHITYTNRDEAAKLLEDGKIKAYIVYDTVPRLFVKRSGINETIIKSVLDSFNRSFATVEAILSKQPDALEKGLLEDVIEFKDFTVEKRNELKPNVVLIYYFALLAFTCLFAANWGLDEVINIQADRSSIGARVNATPVKKLKLMLINMLAAFTVHIGSVFCMILYMVKILNIYFGNYLFHVILTCILGSVTGLFLGAAVGVWINKNYGVQSAILVSMIMFCSFLSGMMFLDMKYLIAKKAPILAYLNPLNLVSDSFYSLYYFDTFNRFYQNISILSVMALVLVTISYMGLRRKTYASI